MQEKLYRIITLICKCVGLGCCNTIELKERSFHIHMVKKFCLSIQELCFYWPFNIHFELYLRRNSKSGFYDNIGGLFTLRHRDEKYLC